VAVVLRPGTTKLDAVSTLLAARLAGATPRVFVEHGAAPLHPALVETLGAEQVLDLAAVREALAGQRWDRLRVVGVGTARALTDLAGIAPSDDVEPVHDSGYVELRRYVVEQSRSLARHRHGNMSLELAARAKPS